VPVHPRTRGGKKQIVKEKASKINRKRQTVLFSSASRSAAAVSSRSSYFGTALRFFVGVEELQLTLEELAAAVPGEEIATNRTDKSRNRNFKCTDVRGDELDDGPA
jgi:hypothetical protein